MGLRDRCGGGRLGGRGRGRGRSRGWWLAVEKTRVGGGAPFPRDVAVLQATPCPPAVIWSHI